MESIAAGCGGGIMRTKIEIDSSDDKVLRELLEGHGTKGYVLAPAMPGSGGSCARLCVALKPGSSDKDQLEAWFHAYRTHVHLRATATRATTAGGASACGTTPEGVVNAIL